MILGKFMIISGTIRDKPPRTPQETRLVLADVSPHSARDIFPVFIDLLTTRVLSFQEWFKGSIRTRDLKIHMPPGWQIPSLQILCKTKTKLQEFSRPFYRSSNALIAN
ncbi:MAG: hypothetical protein ACTSRA_05590 [Promethearchaeota archaeon]